MDHTRTGVEVTVLEELAESAFNANIDKVGNLVPRRRHALFVRQLDAVDPLHRQHAPLRCVPAAYQL